MEFNKTELLEVTKVANDAAEAVRELGELELVVVGGGCGEVIFY